MAFFELLIHSIFVWLYLNTGNVGALPSIVDDFPCKSVNISASRVCKPGPPLASQETSKKCLIIGDSVSIGYTPWLKTSLQDVCQVYHAPWDTVDGGALDTKYALKCLPLFLDSNMLQKIKYDVIIFNFGLHDVNFDNTFPEEFTDEKTYRENLLAIKGYLQGTSSHVGYVLTTPVPFNVTSNDRVKRYNMIARDVMAGGQSLPTADLYGWVVLVCGEPPYNDCVIADKQPSPHYTKQGYKYLSVLVEGLTRKLLEKRFATVPEQKNRNKILNYDNKASYIDELKQDKSVLSCKDKTGNTVTKCPNTMTCSPSKFSMSGWGCCPLTNAVSCKNGKHCCPEGYECDPSCTIRLCFCIMKNEAVLP